MTAEFWPKFFVMKGYFLSSEIFEGHIWYLKMWNENNFFFTAQFY